MRTRSVLLPLAAGGLVLSQWGGTAIAGQPTSIRASFTGSALGHVPSPAAEQCLADPRVAVDFRCRFDTKITFRNKQVHGLREGALHFDFTNASQTGCAQISGQLTDVVFANNGDYLGGFTEQINAGSASCISSRLPDIQTQLLTSRVTRGWGAYRGKKGLIVTDSATVRPVNAGDPIVIAGTFVAQF